MKQKLEMKDIFERIEIGRKAIAEGRGVVADDEYFDSLRKRAEARISSNSE
ncbi:hypothetical protein NBRC116589_43720 [Ruegeria sp. HU-ET01832]|uniref:hypothetical protein n=1 Tax=Ruegeria sp. HU-ET01832 TaxID=3135906 RepID=UPI003106B954